MKRLTRAEKIKTLEETLRRGLIDENLFIKSDEVDGKSFCVAERMGDGCIRTKTDYMSFDGMSCFLKGILIGKANKF
jgi:hypothetical protein